MKLRRLCPASVLVKLTQIIDYTHYHLTLLAQYAPDILPLAMFFLCLALKDLARGVIVLSPLTPC